MGFLENPHYDGGILENPPSYCFQKQKVPATGCGRFFDGGGLGQARSSTLHGLCAPSRSDGLGLIDGFEKFLAAFDDVQVIRRTLLGEHVLSTEG